MSLTQAIMDHGVSPDMLDHLVHDAASQLASSICNTLVDDDQDEAVHEVAGKQASEANNQGIEAQVNLLLVAGFTETEIAEELGIRWEGKPCLA